MRQSTAVLISAALATLAALIPACQQATATPTPSGPTATVPFAQEMQTLRAEIIATLGPQYTVDAMTENAQRTIRAMTPSATPGPTRTPTPTVPSPTPYPTIARTPPAMPPITTVYGQGAVPAGALARIGIGRVAEIELSPDGSILAVGTAAGIYVYDALTGAQMWEDATYAPVAEIEWSADGAWIAVRMWDWGNVLIWDGDTGDFVRRLETGGVVHSIAWSPDRSQIAAGYSLQPRDSPIGSIYRLLIWESRAGEVVADLLLAVDEEGLTDEYRPIPPFGLDWSSAGDRIAVVLGAQNIGLIDPNGGNVVDILAPNSDEINDLYDVRFSPDGDLLAAFTGIVDWEGGGDIRVPVWSVMNGNLLHIFENGGIVSDVSWSVDGTRLATETVNGQMRVWDIATGESLVTTALDSVDLSTLAWSSIGERFITSDPANGELLIWNPAAGERTPFGYQFGDMETYSPTAYMGRNGSGEPLVWDSAAGIPRWLLRTVGGAGNAGWSPDGTMIALRPWDYENSLVTVWRSDGLFIEGYPDTESAPVWVLENTRSESHAPDCLLANGGTLDTPSVGLSISADIGEPDGGRQSEVSVTITITNLSSGQAMQTLSEQGSNVCAAAFSPGGTMVAVSHQSDLAWGSGNIGTSYVTLWDVTTGELLARLEGHTQVAEHLYWSPDGSTLATGSSDGTILIWQIR